MAIYSIVLLMMGEIVTRNMKSKAIANKKRNCCILLDLFHHSDECSFSIEHEEFLDHRNDSEHIKVSVSVSYVNS